MNVGLLSRRALPAVLALMATVAAAACAGSGRSRVVGDAPGTGRVEAPTVPSTASAGLPPVLLRPVVFIEDDVSGAQHRAEAEGKLLFVDVWAPWCHTCLAMRQNVLNRPELGRFSEAVLFAAVDSDRPESAPFLARYRVEAWPTMFLIQPRSGAVLAMHAGSASLAELEALLRSGTDADRTPVAAALQLGHAAFARGDLRGALESYAIARQADDPTLRSQARLGAARTLYELEAFAECAELGAEPEPVVGASAPIDLAFYAFECASSLPAGPASAALVGRVGDRVRQLFAHPPDGASTDDLGDLFALGARVERAAGQRDRARTLEEQGLRLLEESAARAPSPEAAQVHDYARMNAYLALGRGDEAVRMLEARCRELPDRYEPHARLASALEAMGRRREAIGSLARAIALSYGPRRLRYLAKLALLHEAEGDRRASVEALREEVVGWEGLPDGQRSAQQLADARTRLARAESAAGRSAGRPQ